MDNIGDIATLSGVLKRASISAEPQMASVPGAISNHISAYQGTDMQQHGAALHQQRMMHALMQGLP